MPQKPHTIPSTPHRGSGVLPAMVSGGRCSVGAVTIQNSKFLIQNPLPSAPVSIQNSKFKIPHSLPSAPLTFPTLSTILHPHEHGQNPLDPRSSQHRTSQGSRHCGEPRSGLSRAGGRPHETAHDQARWCRTQGGTEHQDRRFQGRDDQVDVPLLDRPDGYHRRSHQVPQVGLSPVAAVCDRRRPQGRDAAPSRSHSRGSASPREPLCNFRQDDRISRIYRSFWTELTKLTEFRTQNCLRHANFKLNS